MIEQDAERSQVVYYADCCLYRFSAGVPGVRPFDPGFVRLVSAYLDYADALVTDDNVDCQHIWGTEDFDRGLPWLNFRPRGSWGRRGMNYWHSRLVSPFRRWVLTQPYWCDVFRWDGRFRVIEGGRAQSYPVFYSRSAHSTGE